MNPTELQLALKILLTTDGRGRHAKADKLRELLRSQGAEVSPQLEALIQEALK